MAPDSPRDSFLISVDHSTSESKMCLNYPINDVFDDFCFYFKKKQLHRVMEFHKNMDLLRHYPVGTIHVPHLHVSVVEPIPTSSEGGGFFPCSEDVSDFHGPVCSSCFWLNHII